MGTLLLAKNTAYRYKGRMEAEMIPSPATKANDILQALWSFFVDDHALTEPMIKHFQNEVDRLSNADPQRALLCQAVMAGIEDNSIEVIRLFDTVNYTGFEEADWLNWCNLLRNLGLMQEAYDLIKRGVQALPGHSILWSMAIHLAQVFDDTELLENALEYWHKLNPGEIYPSVLMAGINNSAFDEDSEQALGLFESALTTSPSIPLAYERPSLRRKRLLRALLDE